FPVARAPRPCASQKQPHGGDGSCHGISAAQGYDSPRMKHRLLSIAAGISLGLALLLICGYILQADCTIYHLPPPASLAPYREMNISIDAGRIRVLASKSSPAPPAIAGIYSPGVNVSFSNSVRFRLPDLRRSLYE